MKYIGNRISWLSSEQGLSIVILSSIDNFKKYILFFWLLAWTVCGALVFTEIFKIQDSNTKIAFIVWMAFWAYFEYKVLTAFIWRQFGKEKIKINNGNLLIKKDISGRGKTQSYQIDFIKDLRLRTTENSFLESLNKSYWVVAGEVLAFDYYGKEIKFGIQLPENEAKEILNIIKQKIINN